MHYTYMPNVTVKIVLSSAQTRLQKGLIPRPEQNDTFQISGPGWVWVPNFDRLPSLLCRTGVPNLGGIPPKGGNKRVPGGEWKVSKIQH